MPELTTISDLKSYGFTISPEMKKVLTCLSKAGQEWDNVSTGKIREARMVPERGLEIIIRQTK